MNVGEYTRGLAAALEERSSGLGDYQVFETGLVLDDDRGTFDLKELPLLEITKEPGHGLSGSADHLGDFFVRKCEREPYLAFSFVMV